ncbi:MAG: hypothetical protein ACOX0Y_03150 [Thiopseudomonas sp.]
MKCNYLGSSLRGLHSWIAKRLETLRLPAKMSSHVAWVILLMMGIFFFALVAVAAVIWFLLASRDTQEDDEGVNTNLFSPFDEDHPGRVSYYHPSYDGFGDNDAGHPDYLLLDD